MKSFFYRVFRLHEGEGPVVFALGFLLVVNAMALQISSIVGLSGFLSDGGVNQYLILLPVNYGIITVITVVQALYIDRFDRRELMGWVVFAFAFIFGIIRAMFSFQVPGAISYGAMYIMSEVQYVVFPLIFWILANDIYQTSVSPRLFPVIASIGLAGKLLGIGIAWYFPTLVKATGVGRQEVLIVNVLIYLIAFVVIKWRLTPLAIQKTHAESLSLKDTLEEAWGFIKEVAAFRYLMFAIVGLTIADTIVEFRFLVITDKAFPTANDYEVFFATYRLGLTLLSLVVQGFLTGRLIKAMGLKNSFLILPVVTLISAVWMIAVPSGPGMLFSAIGAMAILKLIRDTTAETSRKSFQGLVPGERRGRVSLFMDSYLPAFGTISGCILAGIVVVVGTALGFDLYYYAYLGITVLAAMLAIWAVLRLTRTYESSMLNWRLKRRQRGASVLDGLEF
jgi:AAA family ATP:ADP antiporter